MSVRRAIVIALVCGVFNAIAWGFCGYHLLVFAGAMFFGTLFGHWLCDLAKG